MVQSIPITYVFKTQAHKSNNLKPKPDSECLNELWISGYTLYKGEWVFDQEVKNRPWKPNPGDFKYLSLVQFYYRMFTMICFFIY